PCAGRGRLRRCEVGLDQEVQLPEEQRERLVAALDKWRTEKQACRAGGRSLMSKRVDLPDAQLKKRADHGADFLRAAKVTPDLICKFVQLDLASREDLKAIASLIMDWRPDAQLAIGLTPRGGHRQKQQNTAMTPPHPITNTPRREWIRTQKLSELFRTIQLAASGPKRSIQLAT
ncbi:hypothetical protein B0H13DRAFT_1860216, partial [Mycena leptocephala]